MTGAVLVLGGTGPARLLAGQLDARGIPVTTSLAGRTTAPARPPGRVRVGGFGGPDGLLHYLTRASVAAVVDATHPYATAMSRHAAAACAHTGTPLVVLTRPSWSARPDAAAWHWANDHSTAAAKAAQLGAHVLLTVGRQALQDYVGPLGSHLVVARVAERRGVVVPDSWRVVEDRGPFDRHGERQLLERHGIDVLVTKDSGGTDTVAKLDAAAETGVAVVAVRRPVLPAGVTVVDRVEDAVAWCLRALPATSVTDEGPAGPPGR